MIQVKFIVLIDLPMLLWFYNDNSMQFVCSAFKKLSAS